MISGGVAQRPSLNSTPARRRNLVRVSPHERRRLNNSISYTFGDFARLRQTVSPDSGTTNRTFDLAGNTLTETDALGITATRTYDALNRTSTVT